MKKILGPDYHFRGIATVGNPTWFGREGYLFLGGLTWSGENGQEREGKIMRQTAYMDWFSISFAVTMEMFGILYLILISKEDVWFLMFKHF